MQWVLQKDWAKAFDTVIPQRKYNAVGKAAQKRSEIRAREGKVLASGNMDEDDEETMMEKAEMEGRDEEEGDVGGGHSGVQQVPQE